MYEPKPINTANVELPEEIKSLIERLAENAHDIWALQRIKGGWTYGESRNDDQKKHPCLVPYNELPESEKEYDRIMASETLKTIVSMGYGVRKV